MRDRGGGLDASSEKSTKNPRAPCFAARMRATLRCCFIISSQTHICLAGRTELVLFFQAATVQTCSVLLIDAHRNLASLVTTPGCQLYRFPFSSWHFMP